MNLLTALLIEPVEKFNSCHNTSDGKFCSTAGAGRGLVAASADRSQWPEHIRSMRLPPAWTDVQINPDPKAALQAIGKDAKGRSQYVYSKEFQQSQARAKFERMKEMDSKFDGIRAQNADNMQSKNPIVRQHAECTGLIMETGIRPGSSADTKAAKQAYGATTLQGKHVVIKDDKVHLEFVGKKGVAISLPVENKRMAGMLRKRAQQAGQEEQLFPNVSSKSLLDYVHTLNGGKFKTKDFRTLKGTREALIKIRSTAAPKTEKEYKKAVSGVAKHVSSKLGNTPTVALQSYIHPAVFSEWRAGIQ